MAVLGTGVLQPTPGVSQERSAPPGAVTVRPVRLREVSVTPPPSSRDERRPPAGNERAIARHGRDRTFDAFKPRFGSHAAAVVGYPVVYPYALPFDPFSPAPAMSYSVATARTSYSSVDSVTSRGGNLTSTEAFPGAVACEHETPCGGVSFDVTPVSAQVFVDGVFAGIVGDFATTTAPLLLAPGDYFIEVRLAGFRTASIDVTITAGAVTPYQGRLERLRQRRQ
jgi:hypothetical protein